MCVACTKISACVRNSVHLPVKEGLMTSGVETEVMQNSSRIVKMSVVTLDGRRTGHLLVHCVWLLNNY